MSPTPPPPAVTLGAHLGDNSVDYVPITAVKLGTTGGCHGSFMYPSTGRHLASAFASHPPVEQTRRADLRVWRLSPLSTAPTTTTTISIPQKCRTAVSRAGTPSAPSHRVTTPMLLLGQGRPMSSPMSSDPEDFS